MFSIAVDVGVVEPRFAIGLPCHVAHAIMSPLCEYDKVGEISPES
jgi:hypothetical protein